MRFHPLLRQKVFSCFNELESQIELLPTTKEKGDAFEDFVYCYLRINSQKYQIKEVHRISEAPKDLLNNYHIEKRDSGVDGIFLTLSGKVCGYQVKFRTNRTKPSYDELAKFWVESQHTDFRYTIANCYEITELARKQRDHIELLVGEFENLTKDFFKELYQFVTWERFERVINEPFDFQKDIIKDVIDGFKSEDRGKFIAACGTGKTITSLWITEEMRCNEILFLAPSLALIKQTLEEWANQSKASFSYLCVCSDETVSKEVEELGDIAISDFDVPVTTDSKLVVEFLSKKSNYKRVVFSTYQSLAVIANALDECRSFKFDIAIFDEAHRTAGAKYSELFNLGLDDKFIRCNKRLFMTATERMVLPRLKEQAEESNRIVFSMDDKEVYGNTFHRLNFGKAISLKIISDYRIVIAAIREKEVYEWIKSNTELEDNDENISAFAQVIFSQILYTKAIRNYGISKTISFHSSIKNSQIFTSGLFTRYSLKSIIEMFDPDVPQDDLYINHIDGSFSAGRRREILDEFKRSRYGIVSNSRCLTEGVDVPIIDSIYFVDPKNSLIDIVQACGRALRKPKDIDSKIAYIILPILIPEGIDSEELFNSEKFEYVFNVIQALRDQDNRLEQWIDLLNRNVSKGKYTKPHWSPIDIDLPSGFDIHKFEESLLTRIAIVNSEPTDLQYRKPQIWGKNGRKSHYKRIFTPICDYAAESLRQKLIDPTITKFKSSNDVIPIALLKLSHNNVSHTKRLGLINEHKDNYFVLTPLGKQYFKNEIDFITLFKNQLLKHFVLDNKYPERIIFPYRALLEILLKTKEISLLHFAYPISAIYDSSENSLNAAIQGIEYINQEYPNPALLNETNRKKLVKEFNEIWGIDHKYNNIWTSLTTVYNQMTYFRNHLGLFNSIIEIDPKTKNIRLSSGKEKEVIRLLSNDSDLETIKEPDKLLARYINFISLFVVSLGGIA